MQNYPFLIRGTSAAIPIYLLDEHNMPLNLEGLSVVFTLKEDIWDNDYDDVHAVIQKTATVEDDHFLVSLTSSETWITPRTYYFDLMLNDSGVIIRLGIFSTEVIGTPTNSLQNDTVSAESTRAIYCHYTQCPPVHVHVDYPRKYANYLPTQQVSTILTHSVDYAITDILVDTPDFPFKNFVWHLTEHGDFYSDTEVELIATNRHRHDPAKIIENRVNFVINVTTPAGDLLEIRGFRIFEKYPVQITLYQKMS